MRSAEQKEAAAARARQALARLANGRLARGFTSWQASWERRNWRLQVLTSAAGSLLRWEQARGFAAALHGGFSIPREHRTASSCGEGNGSSNFKASIAGGGPLHFLE